MHATDGSSSPPYRVQEKRSVALRLTVELARRCPPEQLPTALSSAGTLLTFFLCSSLSRPSPHSFPLFLSSPPFPSFPSPSLPTLLFSYYQRSSASSPAASTANTHSLPSPGPPSQTWWPPPGPTPPPAWPWPACSCSAEGYVGWVVACLFGPYLSPYLCPYLSSSRPLSVLLSVAAWPWPACSCSAEGYVNWVVGVSV